MCVNPHLLPQPAQMELPEVLAIQEDLQDQKAMCRFKLTLGYCLHACQLQSRMFTFPPNPHAGRCMRHVRSYRALVWIIETLDKLDHS